MKYTVIAVLAATLLLSGCTQNVRTLREEGVREFQLGRMEIARAYFRQVLREEPSDPAALYYMGRIAHDRGDLGRAVYYYQCCLDADPGFPTAGEWLLRARADAEAADIPVSEDLDLKATDS